MQIPDNPTEMTQVIADYRSTHIVDLPADARTKFLQADSQSGPARFLAAMEALYTVRDELDEAGKTLVAQIAGFCALWGWPGGDPRPGKIQAAMRRDLGEQLPAGMGWPDRANDPAPIGESGLPGVTPTDAESGG